MIEVYKNLFVGSLQDCENEDLKNLARVHACKIPCHQNAVGYRGNLDPHHPNYLVLEKENDLYINLVDISHIEPFFTNQIFERSFQFIEKKLQANKKTLVHCNYGQSRSSSIAIVYLAQKGIINRATFEEAHEEFCGLYKHCNLGFGFYSYLIREWKNLLDKQ